MTRGHTMGVDNDHFDPGSPGKHVAQDPGPPVAISRRDDRSPMSARSDVPVTSTRPRTGRSPGSVHRGGTTIGG